MVDAVIGTGTLHFPHLSIPCTCRLFAGGEVREPVEIECEVSLANDLSQFRVGTSLTLTTTLVNAEVACFVASFPQPHLTEAGAANPLASITLRPHRTPLLWHNDAMLCRLEAGLINFSVHSQIQPLLLSGGGWLVTLSHHRPGSEEAGEYRVTHSIVVKRSDGETFLASQAHQFLHSLSLFLSFCLDRYVAPTHVRGLTATNEIALREYGTRPLQTFREASGWVDRCYPKAIAEALPGFMKALGRTELEKTVRYAIYWYLRADTNYTGPDGGIILEQAALERLAWQLSKSAFTGRTHRPLRRSGVCLMTYRFRPPSPDSFQELRHFASENEFKDGPHVFTAIRNSLTHPSSEMKRNPPYAQAYLLGKWWIELCLLNLFEFNGDYSNRTVQQRWVGAVERVPWVK